MRTPISVHASDPRRHVQPPFREWALATFPPTHAPWPRRRARMLRRPFRVATRAVTAAVALGLGWMTSGPATADGQRVAGDVLQIGRGRLIRQIVTLTVR